MGAFRKRRLEHANQVFIRVLLVATIVCLIAVLFTPREPTNAQTQFWQKRDIRALPEEDVSCLCAHILESH